MARIPAKYVGQHPVSLSGGPYYNIDGTRRTDMTLSNGDTLMVEDREVLGQSFLFDPKGQREPLSLGVGKVVLPEHAHLSDQELAEIGYEFHKGRNDMEPIEAQPALPAQQEQPTKEPPIEDQNTNNPQEEVQVEHVESGEVEEEKIDS